ncbi:hypothetical protein SDC9_149005 [bioreactor metagenome]|uniref:Uncharacterized protein n=1 Tax=bioreactor metagenome TaxID=1076179 RepID=A0A645EMP3_9ZZZZ|nr:hypothetical protein [Candidatus Pelethousia sp.]
MAIVKDYYIGNTHVMIDDEYCVKTQEEVDAILKKVGQLSYEQAIRRMAREAMQKGETTAP